MSLSEWVKTQYGEGKPYKTRRALSLAVSEGRNSNVIHDIETRGSARIETLRRLAETLRVPVVLVLLCAGLLDEADLDLPEDRLNEEERELLALYRRTRPDLRRVAVAGLRAASQFPPEQSED